jgi:hypothetical protein
MIIYDRLEAKEPSEEPVCAALSLRATEPALRAISTRKMAPSTAQRSGAVQAKNKSLDVRLARGVTHPGEPMGLTPAYPSELAGGGSIQTEKSRPAKLAMRKCSGIDLKSPLGVRRTNDRVQPETVNTDGVLGRLRWAGAATRPRPRVPPYSGAALSRCVFLAKVGGIQ